MEQNTRKNINTLAWSAIITLAAVGVFANSYFSDVALALRLAVWIVLVCIVIGLAALTTQGKRFWSFSKDARMELRKVVWPTKDETIKTTMVIAGLVVVMAIIMWGVDSILLWMIGWLTGQK